MRGAMPKGGPAVAGCRRQSGKRSGRIYYDASLWAAAAIAICLLLSVCAATREVRWVKTGAGDATVSRELQDCNAQASAGFASERGIN